MPTQIVSLLVNPDQLEIRSSNLLDVLIDRLELKTIQSRCNHDLGFGGAKVT